MNVFVLPQHDMASDGDAPTVDSTRTMATTIII